jgi:K+-transporting ATPase KdpF subunit
VVLRGGLVVENVILSIGAILVMAYLLVALIRPERF